MQAPRVPGPWLVPPQSPVPGPTFPMIAMQTGKTCEIHGCAHQGVADDTLTVGWLKDMGLVTIDENGSWSLTALGQAAMARFDSGYNGAEPAHL